MSSDSEEIEIRKGKSTNKPKENDNDSMKGNANKALNTDRNARENQSPLLSRNGSTEAKVSKTITLEEEI